MDVETACIALDAAADHNGEAEIEGVGRCKTIWVCISIDSSTGTVVDLRRGYLLHGNTVWLARDDEGNLVHRGI